MKKRICRTVMSVALLSVSMFVNAQDPGKKYSRIVLFGDSQLDTGNIFFKRFTKGDGNFAEQVFGRTFIDGLRLSDRIKENKVNINMAQGGAKLVTTDFLLLSPIITQSDTFLQRGGRFNEDDLVIIMAGGNDVIEQGYSGARSPEVAGAELNKGRLDLLAKITAQGAKHLLFGNIPDLRVTPKLLNWKVGQSAKLVEWLPFELHKGLSLEKVVATDKIARLAAYTNEQTTITALNVVGERAGLDLTLIDLHKLLAQIAKEGKRFGIDGALDISEDGSKNKDVKFLTQDDLHPSPATSRVIADAYKAFFENPVAALRARMDGKVNFDAPRDAFTSISTLEKPGGRYHRLDGGLLDISFQSQADALSSRVGLNGAVLRIDGDAENIIDSVRARHLTTALLLGDGDHGGAIEVAGETTQFEYAGNALGGTLVKSGAGSLWLTGDNRLGQLQVADGTLRVGDGGSKGWFEGNVLNDSVLLFDRGDDKTFSDRIDGRGVLFKDGMGLLNLTGAGSISGGTEVRQGGLAFNGLFESTDVRVGNGAWVQGSGRVRSLTLQDGSQIRPGNSIGTFEVVNDVVFDKGSTYLLEVNLAGASDSIRAGGVADIKGGRVVVDGEKGRYEPSTRYEVLSAGGGVKGRFDQLQASELAGDFAFLTPSLDYAPGQVWLQFARNTQAPEDMCIGSNAKSACRTLLPEVGSPETKAPTSEVRQKEITAVIGLTKPSFVQLSTKLAGEIHPAVQTALTHASSQLIDTIGKRQYAVSSGASKAGSWGQALGSQGRQDGDHGIAGLRSNVQGFIVGLDAQVVDADLTVGLFGGYRKVSLSQGRSSGGIDTYELGIYGAKRYDAASLRLGVNAAWHEMQTRRKIDYRDGTSTPDANYQGNTLQAFSEVAYDLHHGKLGVEPYIGLSFSRLEVSSFREEVDVFALSGKRQVKQTHAGRLGARLNYDLHYDDKMKFGLQAGGGFKHLLSGVDSKTDMAFRSHPSDLRIDGLPSKRDVALLNAKISAQWANGLSLGLDYQNEWASGWRDQSISTVASWDF